MSADPLDQALDVTERYLAAGLAAARMTGRGPAPTGCCLFCDEEATPASARWCSTWCRDSWQKEQDMLQRLGPGGADPPGRRTS